MKFFAALLSLVSLLTVTVQAQQTPIRVKDGRLVKVMVDAEKDITYTVSQGSWGPKVNLHAHVSPKDCMDLFPDLEDMMINLESTGQNNTRVLRMYVYEHREFSTCIGFDSRPTTLQIDPGVVEPYTTVLHQLDGNETHVQTLVELENNEWVLKSVQILKNQPPTSQQ
jgi:hypothetical protein